MIFIVLDKWFNCAADKAIDKGDTVSTDCDH